MERGREGRMDGGKDEGKMVGGREGWMDRIMEGSIDVWTGLGMDGCMHGRMEGRKDRWMDGKRKDRWRNEWIN